MKSDVGEYRLNLSGSCYSLLPAVTNTAAAINGQEFPDRL